MTMPIPKEIKKLFSTARILGNGDSRVSLSENELFCLLTQCCSDLSIPSDASKLPNLSNPPPCENYYRVPLEWWRIEQSDCPTASKLIDSLAACIAHESDFGLYFGNLAALHKRRLKYQNILSTQPRPTMNQIGPRSLLEFGGVQSELLAAWLVWRKWIFDIDNRAAQETGYLFEPVLASCLGGEAVGSKNSPVKRINEQGEPTKDGRQIDCYDGENQLAYEFKLRVTIAASGQGRFGEELSYPKECQAAGLTPVLVVLDPTPSSRLTELVAKFTEHGGMHYVGTDAWDHMDSKAGATMAVFLERYIRPPLTEMATHEDTGPESIQISWASDEILIRGNAETIRIPRTV